MNALKWKCIRKLNQQQRDENVRRRSMLGATLREGAGDQTTELWFLPNR
jgi:hypothetical protein